MTRGWIALLDAVRAAMADLVAQVRAINHRYASPRLAMSPATRWSLLGLRLYLLLLVGLLAYKFVVVVTH